MKTRRVFRYLCAVCLPPALAFFLPLAPSLAEGQTTPAPHRSGQSPATTDTEVGKTESKDEIPKPAGGKPKTVALNLNKVNIDQVIKFLSEITGKIVMKHKDAKAQITIVSPREVAQEKAFRLITDALRLEKVAVVEKNDVIWLMPMSLLPDIDVELISPAARRTGVGVVRKVIPIHLGDVSEIAKLVKPLLSKEATLLADPTSRKIIVTDTVERVANLESLIAQLDTLCLDERQMQIFPLKYADADELASILRTVLRPSGARPGAKPAPGAPSQAVEVVAYKAANWLVVVASKDKLTTAKELIDKLDEQKPKELELRVISLQYAEAMGLATQLSRLFERRKDKRGRETVVITADERSNSLLVLSSVNNYELIEQVVKNLDTEESVQMTTKTYELNYADADDIAEQMNDLYSGMERNYGYDYYPFYYPSRPSQRAGRTRFVPERRTNSVIAIAPPSEFENIDTLIEKLDQPIDQEQVAPRIYRITYIDAKELAEMLNEVFGTEEVSQTSGYYYYEYLMRQAPKTKVGRLYGKVRFVADTATNSIIVTTNNKENFPIIEKFIQALDQVGPEIGNTMVRQLKHAKAADVADQLNRLFARPGARAPEKKKTEETPGPSYYNPWLYGTPGKKEERPISNLIGQVRVVADSRANALLITTAAQNFKTLDSLIDELDRPSPKVFVSIRLVEITTARSVRIGTRYSSASTIFESDDFDQGLRSEFGFSWKEIHGNGTLNADVNVDLLIQFLQRHFDSRILSEPTLAMDNNVPATLFVGSEIPFIEKSQISAEGTSRSDSYKYRKAGTIMEITPNINQVNKVVMTVKLESSQIRPGEMLFGGAILDTRNFTTELAVDDAQTMVIGGIMRQEQSEQLRRVPILGYIPILKYLFRKKDTRYATTELVAFITPTVLTTSQEDLATTHQAAKRLNVTKDWQPLPETINQQTEQQQPDESQN